MGDNNDCFVTANDLPISFAIKYLGSQPAKGLWGMKHTRKPVDYLVSQAKNLSSNVILPIVKFTVTINGVQFVEITNKKLAQSPPTKFSVDIISYGVQDLIYTRVFSMIVVIDDNLKNGVPFECHSFLCESRDQARQITYALAAVFQDYGKKNKANGSKKPVFAIDLRTPEEQAVASDGETEA